ncbi:MAG: hypothetical protein Kow0056_16680 [Coriobacteriia bacterium]
MATYEVDPISRIEGHLGVTLTVNGSSTITEADVHANLWRGFENFLIGREINDAITFTQRICGVCPLPHATASTFAADACFGYSPGYMTFPGTGASDVPAAAVYIRNLVYASEFIMSHITHFYHLAAPSYIQGPAMPPWTPYFADSYYSDFLDNPTNRAVPDVSYDGTFSDNLWSAVIRSYVKALRMRRITFEAGALFAGRMPMVASYVAGGTTNYFGSGELAEKCNMFYNMFKEVGFFIFKELVPINLALGVLYPEYDNTNNTHYPTGTGKGFGDGYGNFLAWGAFPQTNDQPAIKGGFKFGYGSATGIQIFMDSKACLSASAISVTGTDGTTYSASTVMDLVEQCLTEDVAKSRYEASTAWGFPTGQTAAFPGDVTRTKPVRDDESNRYSWMKAPRWMGEPMEVGPFARCVVNGWYPVDGTVLVSSTVANAWPSGFANPRTYVRATHSTTGLRPELVEADIAVGLVREGLASLTLFTTAGTSISVGKSVLATSSGVGGSTSQIVDAYVNWTVGGTAYDTALITGTVVNAIAGMKGGLSTMDRLRGRALEAAVLVQLMIGAFDGTKFGSGSGTNSSSGWIGALANFSGYDAQTYPTTPRSNPTSTGGYKMGVSEAPRGALAHFATVEEGKISAYQCVVPTTWNACPKDGNNKRGPIEQAIVGASFVAATTTLSGVGATSYQPVGCLEALRIAQSFDPCIACAVH